MKILSNTENGGRVVELSRAEMRELFLLAKTCDENVMDEVEANWQLYARGDDVDRYDTSIHGFDFSHLFSVIHAWRQAKFTVNKLKSLTAGIEAAINNANN